MPPNPSNESFDRFVQLVDKWITPPMRELGYDRIGAFQRQSTGNSSPTVVEVAVGFEAMTEEARRRLDKDDPASADEVWFALDATSMTLDRNFAANRELHALVDSGKLTGPIDDQLAEIGRFLREMVQRGPAAPSP